jgi:uncharacterized membrane protein HdeD (DUF308 family)
MRERTRSDLASGERGLIWILVLGMLLIVAGTYHLVTRELSEGLSSYEWATGGVTLSLGAFLALTFLERRTARRKAWRRSLAAVRWSCLCLFFVFVGIASFVGLSEAIG